MRKAILLSLALVGGLAFAQDKLDPCGSPKGVYSKYLLDKCYKGYFDAIMDAKKKADEALNKANALEGRVNNLEGNVNNLEGKVNNLEGMVNDHERRIRALEGRRAEEPRRETTTTVGPGWQLEEVGAVYFDFNKFNIRKSEAEKLDEMARKIKDDAREVLVVGFADTRGPSQYNFNLSMYRAQMVASELAKRGVDIGKIRIASYGKEVAELISPKYAEQRAVKIYFIK